MKKNKTILIFLLFLFSGWDMPIFWKKKKADNLYSQKEYLKALDLYQDIQTNGNDKAVAGYNKGNTLYRLGRYDEAENALKKALQSKDENVLEKAHYNIGNALYRQGRLEEAIKSYEETLKIDSTDEDTIYNIEFIKKKLQAEQQQQDKKKDKNKNENQDKQNKQEEQGKKQTTSDQKQDKKENKNEGESRDIKKQAHENKKENKSESEKDKKNNKKNTGKKDKNSPEEKAKTEQARQILDAIKLDEKKLKQNLNEKEEFNKQEEKVEYDW
ncbi:MAG: tetratricopeptide repeat protein [bacterium]